MKSKGIAYLLWFFLGVFSAHRLYLKKYRTAILYLLTFQLLGIGWLIDLFDLGRMVDKYNLIHGYYGPRQNQNVFVNVHSGNKQPKPSLKEQPIAS